MRKRLKEGTVKFSDRVQSARKKVANGLADDNYKLGVAVDRMFSQVLPKPRVICVPRSKGTH